MVRGGGRAVTLALAAVCLMQSRVWAQSDGERTAGLYGYVRDAATGDPVADVVVVLEEAGRRALTNEYGFFAVDSLAPGLEVLRFEHLAFDDRERAVRLEPGSSSRVDVGLATAVLEAEPLTVTVRGSRRVRQMRAFERRREIRSGRFYDSRDLQRVTTLRVGTLLRDVPGVRLVSPAGGASPLRRSWWVEMRGRECQPNVWIDGRRIWFGWELWLNELAPDDLEALEIYRAGETPAEFDLEDCVTLVAWTRWGR